MYRKSQHTFRLILTREKEEKQHHTTVDACIIYISSTENRLEERNRIGGKITPFLF